MRKGIILALAVLATAILVYGEEALAKEKHKKTVTVANLNIFHGIPCALAEEQRGEQITQCRLSERIDLLFKHLVATDCPDIVTLQEVLDRKSVATLTSNGLVTIPEDPKEALTSVLGLIKAKLKPLARVCGFKYEFLYAADLIDPQKGPLFQRTDEELILSRYPIAQAKVRLLHSALFVPDVSNAPPELRPFLQAFARHVLFARIHHPVGLIDIFTTHLAASEDFGDNNCHSKESFSFPLPDEQGTSNIMFDVPCPEECDPLQTLRECEARQVANFVKELHKVGTPAFVTGDLNATPSHDGTVYDEFINADPDRRWRDSHLEARNPECDGGPPLEGIGCTAGRDAVGDDLEKPARNVDERIDYIFVVPSRQCDIQEQGTGLFADEPNPFLRKHKHCGFPDPICWASDHNGNRVNLSCERSTHHDFSLVPGDSREDTR